MSDNKALFEGFLQYVQAQASGDKKEPTREEKTAWVKSIATNPDARKAFAETRGDLIRPIQDRTATARKVFDVIQVADGAQVVFPVSFDEVECAWVAPSISSYPNRLLEGDEVWVPVFPIKAGVEYGRDLFVDGRFDIAEQATRLLGIRVVFNEDLSAWNLVTNVVADSGFPAANSVEIGTANNGTVSTTTGEGFFSRELVNDMVTQSDVQRAMINQIFVTPLSYGDIRDWAETSISQQTQTEIFNAAGLEFVYSVKLNKMDTTDFFSNRRAYGVRSYAPDGDSFGRFAEKDSLATRDNPMSDLQDKIGVLARERIGLAAMRAAALISATIDR